MRWSKLGLVRVKVQFGIPQSTCEWTFKTKLPKSKI